MTVQVPSLSRRPTPPNGCQLTRIYSQEADDVRITVVQGDNTQQSVDAGVNDAKPGPLAAVLPSMARFPLAVVCRSAACRRLRADELPDGLPVGRAVGHDRRQPARDLGHPHRRFGVPAVSGPHGGPCVGLSRVASRRGPPRRPDRCVSPRSPPVRTGWPLDHAARITVETLRAVPTEVDEVRLVAFGTAEEHPSACRGSILEDELQPRPRPDQEAECRTTRRCCVRDAVARGGWPCSRCTRLHWTSRAPATPVA